MLQKCFLWLNIIVPKGKGEQQMNITELEAKLINYIKNDFTHNKEFTETSVDEYLHYTKDFPIDPKQVRGIFTTLKRKKVIDYFNDPHCWNPIYKGERWNEALAIAEAR